MSKLLFATKYLLVRLVFPSQAGDPEQRPAQCTLWNMKYCRGQVSWLHCFCLGPKHYKLWNVVPNWILKIQLSHLPRTFFWAACNSAGYSMLGLLSKSRGTVQCKMHQILVYSTRHAANSLHKSTAKQCSGTGSNNNLLWPVRCHLNMQLTLSSSSTVPSIYCLKTLYRVNVVFPVFIWHLSTHQSQTKLKNWSLNHSYRPAPGI